MLHHLTASGALPATSLERVQLLAEETGERPEQVAVKLGLLAERDLAHAYAKSLARPLVTTAELAAIAAPVPHLTERFLRHARIVPLADSGETLAVAMADPYDRQALAAIRFALEREVIPRAALPADIEATLDRLFIRAATAGPGPIAIENTEGDRDRLKDLASEALVIRLVNQIIARAVEAGASDIHLEATGHGLRLRTRIDGVLRDLDPPPAGLASAIVSRLKIMARLDIAERRLAQDGRIRLAVRGRDVDFRLATTPSIHGEGVVLRILDRGALRLDFAALGFDDALLPRYRQVLDQPNGILLVTGPTGSGKTTTLYASLAALNTPETKILTVEDPVEYVLPGITQVEVNPQIGRTFAGALRSFLRLDPNVVMIGEVRDGETARIAVQAALTGQRVLSTVHTNDAASAIARLLDMGIEDYLLTATIKGILAQRLVRRLCRACRQPTVAPPELLARLGLDPAGPAVLHRAAGCPACGGTGYAGRTMILELLVMSDTLRTLVLKHAEAREIRAVAIGEGMRTMFAHGARLALDGVTTIEEVMRAVRDV